jgi:hypothetical protein
LLYAGWVEADRVFNARTILLQQVKKDHGLRLTMESSDTLENGVLLIDKSEVSLGIHGSGLLEGIRIENQKVVIKSGKFMVFDDNPWQWVYGLCGKGQKVQVVIENLVVKSATGKMNSLGKFEIQSNGIQGLKGYCNSFTTEQISDSVYVAEGDLFAFIPSFEKLHSVGFAKVAMPKAAREINGVGYSSFEITAFQSLLFRVSRPAECNSNWREKSAKGFSVFDNIILEFDLTPDSSEITASGKSEGFVWSGKINTYSEEYQVYVEGDVTLASLLQFGAFSDHYLVPDPWQNKLTGLYELKRNISNGNLEVMAISENRSVVLYEVKP